MVSYKEAEDVMWPLRECTLPECVWVTILVYELIMVGWLNLRSSSPVIISACICLYLFMHPWWIGVLRCCEHFVCVCVCPVFMHILHILLPVTYKTLMPFSASANSFGNARASGWMCAIKYQDCITSLVVMSDRYGESEIIGSDDISNLLLRMTLWSDCKQYCQSHRMKMWDITFAASNFGHVLLYFRNGLAT